MPSSHLLAAAFVLGLAGSLAARPPAPLTACGSLGLAVLALLAPGPVRFVALAGALTLAGLALGSARLERLDRSVLARSIGESGPALVEVTGPARHSDLAVSVPVRVLELWHRTLSERSVLRLPTGRAPPPQGAKLTAIVTIHSPRGHDEEGGFDERRYLARQGIHVVLGAHSYRLSGQRGGPVGVADAVRAGLSTSVAGDLTGERRALVAGVVLGADEGLSEALREAFRRSGLYHLLAVSGQNVAYVAAGVVLLAWMLGLRRRVAEGVALSAIVAYVAAVGWQPSIVRAGVAGALASLAWILDRGRDRWYFALVGAAVLLAWNPYSLLEPGFQLSFVAVAAIFLLVPALDTRLERLGLPRGIRKVLSVSIACTIATAPVLWVHFGALAVYAVPANALAAPVVAPILALGLGAGGLAPLLPDAAHGLAWANGWLVAYLAWVARTASGLPGASIDSYRTLLSVLGALALAALLRRAPRVLRRSLAVGVTACVAASVVWVLPRSVHALPAPSGLRVAALDVGQGDSILLQVPGGAILVDEGPPEAHVVRLLRRLGVTHLTAVVLTHPQRDHVGGAAEVLEELPVDVVLDPAIPAENGDERRALEAARARDVPVQTVRAGERFRIGALTIRVLWPDGPGTSGEDPNNRAVVLLASYGGTDVLLTADAESDVTGRLNLPEVEILKVAHHGSADPGLPALLRALQPRVALVSLGLHNEYGHPAAETVQALSAVPGLQLYRTDRDGTVVVESDGRSITVRRRV